MQPSIRRANARTKNKRRGRMRDNLALPRRTWRSLLP